MQKSLSLPNLMVALMILISGGLMLNAAWGDSAIFDETAHIVAGYNYVKNMDYRFNPEHPPLIKILATLPLVFQKLNFSKDAGYWNGTNEQWWAGNEFLYKSGNNADEAIFSARLGPILLTLLTIFFIYYFARELVGRWWALLPAFLFAFSPIVLAHGHYVTTNMTVTLGALLTVFYFVRLMDNYNSRNLFAAAAAFGFAQAAGFSLILLIPTVVLIAGAHFLINRQSQTKTLYKNCKAVFLTVFIGYLAIIYPLYLLGTWNYPIEKQAADTADILQNFAFRPIANFNVGLAGNPVLRPFGEYLLGILTAFQHSGGDGRAYFHFPLIYFMKESLPALIFIFAGFFLALARIAGSFKDRFLLVKKLKEYLQVRFLESAMIIFMIIYWLSTVYGPFNIGVRQILPTVPFIYILSTSAIKKWFSSEPREIAISWLEYLENSWHSIFNFWLKTFLLSALVIWVFAETALASPNFLPYFNEFFGWRNNGFYYAVNSDFDWGQDLKRLKTWSRLNLEPDEKIAVDYFGGGDVKYYLGDQAEPWQSTKGNPKDEGINWLAISANILVEALTEPISGFYKNPADKYLWLENPYSFIDRAGVSIFIYKL